jgi:hypothetical protein
MPFVRVGQCIRDSRKPTAYRACIPVALWRTSRRRKRAERRWRSSSIDHFEKERQEQEEHTRPLEQRAE